MTDETKREFLDGQTASDFDDSFDPTWSNNVPENLKVTERARPYFKEVFSDEEKKKKYEVKRSKFSAVEDKKEDLSPTPNDVKADEPKSADGTTSTEDDKVLDEIPTVTAEAVEDEKEIKKESDYTRPIMDESDYVNPPFIYRNGWGAVKPKSVQFQPSPATVLIFTDTGTPQCQTPEQCSTIVEQLQQKHIRQGLDDIRYNFLLGGDGYVYEGRGYNAVPNLEPKHKKFEGRSLLFAYIGTFPQKRVGIDLLKLGVRLLTTAYLTRFITEKVDVIMFDKEPSPIVITDQPLLPA